MKTKSSVAFWPAQFSITTWGRTHTSPFLYASLCYPYTNPKGFGLENEQFNTGSSPLGTLGSYWMMTLSGTTLSGLRETEAHQNATIIGHVSCVSHPVLFVGLYFCMTFCVSYFPILRTKTILRKSWKNQHLQNIENNLCLKTSYSKSHVWLRIR